VQHDEMIDALQNYFKGKTPSSIHEGVFLYLRLPRVLLCAIAGGLLSITGVYMQGLFRNPLVEPGMIGTSAGAALGASIVFVLGGMMPIALKVTLGPWLTPLFAFIGAGLFTYLVHLLSNNTSKISVLHILLVGLAMNALAMSGTGFMTYLARDPQARSINFWSLGTFTGADWMQVKIATVLLVIAIVASYYFIKPLNAILLGEEEAAMLGIPLRKFRRNLLIINTLLVAIITSFVGVIGFIGLIVPHIARILVGSNHKYLIPTSLLIGSILLSMADIAARLLLAPAEIPIGIITSLIGAPIFIILLRRHLVITKHD
jgi:iron complex transport system permease protein